MGIIVAFRQAWGHDPVLSDRLHIFSSSPLANGPRAFRNVGGMSSGPAAPDDLIALIALFSSTSLIGEQL